MLYSFQRVFRWKVWKRASGITIQHQPARIPCFVNNKINKKVSVIVPRLHSGLYSSSKVEKIDTPNCETCGVQHLLVDCIKYHNQSNLLMCKYNFNGYDVRLFITILSNKNAALEIFGNFHKSEFLCLQYTVR